MSDDVTLPDPPDNDNARPKRETLASLRAERDALLLEIQALHAQLDERDAQTAAVVVDVAVDDDPIAATLAPLPLPQPHHDGHGLADRIYVVADPRDPNNGNASHHYRIFLVDAEGDGTEYARIQFQHGPQTEATSRPGILDGALITVLLDRLAGFQSGTFASKENQDARHHLVRALGAFQARAHRRAKAGTLGTRQGR
jgi:hypothetical protein